MKNVKYKHFRALQWHDRIPRKRKKAILGLKVSGCELRRKLKTVIQLTQITTMFERPEFNTGSFCPKCGCGAYYGTGNKTEYPEHWEYFYCLRCKNVVGVIDNSPFYHVLQFAPEFEIPF